MLEIVIILSEIALGVSIFGYLFSVIKEGVDIVNEEVHISSKRVTQQIVDDLDYKVFRLGKTRLMIGDEIKIYLKDKKLIRGIVVGARKKTNALCIVTEKDEVMELKIASIKKLKVITKYGKLF
ncbi:MAG: hypothetical protein JXO44_00370 [Clostridia bacterium]|nr:hypothetical protein [Clostridia bacterium]